MNKKTQKTLFSTGTDNWETPPEFFAKLNKMFGPFTLDPCATPETAKCEVYYTAEQDGLKQSWKGQKVYVNPPYSRKLQKAFIEKCWTEAQNDDTMVVMLVPARTCKKDWHEYCMNASAVYFVKGRLKFWVDGEPAKHAAPFPSAVVVFSKDHKNYCVGAGPYMCSMERV